MYIIITNLYYVKFFLILIFVLDAYPWQISLQMRQLGIFSHICGGSVIDEWTIVCAAHCVVGEVEEQVQVFKLGHLLPA